MVLLPHAAAEYVGVAFSRGLQSAGDFAGVAGRWIGNHPVEIGIGLLVLCGLLKLLRSR